MDAVDSILNNRPPKGQPKAKVIPVAQAALNIVVFKLVDLSIFSK